MKEKTGTSNQTSTTIILQKMKTNEWWMFGSTRIQLMIEDLSGKNLFSGPTDNCCFFSFNGRVGRTQKEINR